MPVSTVAVGFCAKPLYSNDVLDHTTDTVFDLISKYTSVSLNSNV